MTFLKFAMSSLILLAVVLSSEFTSIKDKRDIWYCLTLYEERNVQKLDNIVRKRIAEVEKETSLILKDLKLKDGIVELKDFVLNVKKNYSNLLVQSFYSKEFHDEERHVKYANLDLGFEEIAFKAVEQYYLQCLPKILEHNVSTVVIGQRKRIQNLILKYLTDHTGFGPSGVTYFSPNMMSRGRRRKCKNKFATLKKKEFMIIDCCLPKITCWLAHRYLQADPTKLNSLARDLKYTTWIKYIATPFNINDEKFAENSRLAWEVNLKPTEAQCKECLQLAVCEEIKSFVESAGHHPVHYNEEYPMMKGWNIQVAYVSTGLKMAQLRKFVYDNPGKAVVIFYLGSVVLYLGAILILGQLGLIEDPTPGLILQKISNRSGRAQTQGLQALKNIVEGQKQIMEKFLGKRVNRQ
jgi:hypothetical protein